MSLSPVSSQKGNEKKGSREASKLAAGRATNIDGSIDRACASVENLVLSSCNCPAEGSSRGKQAAVGGDDEAVAGAKCAPYFQVGALLVVGVEESPIPLRQGREVCLERGVFDWSLVFRMKGRVEWDWWLTPFVAVSEKGRGDVTFPELDL